jgi:hypothetical protein
VAAGLASGTALSTICSAGLCWDMVGNSLKNEMGPVHYSSTNEQSQEMKRLHFILIWNKVGASDSLQALPTVFHHVC